MMDGKTSVFTVQLPAVAEVVPWDGKEGQAMEEEVRVGGTLTCPSTHCAPPIACVGRSLRVRTSQEDGSAERAGVRSSAGWVCSLGLGLGLGLGLTLALTLTLTLATLTLTLALPLTLPGVLA